MGKERILIVDDEEVNIKLLKAMLHLEDYELVGAHSGEEAVHAVEREIPDLVLLDVMMPGINGFEVCRRLKSNEETRVIPVIMVTALREKEHRVKAVEAGADDFLSKPVDQFELQTRVRSLLRIKAYHDELLCNYREISEKNAKLEELEKVKRGLTHMIIHDLNNPLSAVFGGVQLLLTQEEDFSEKQVQTMTQCLHFCEDLRRQIQSLLDIHQMEEVGIKPAREETNMASLVQEVFSLFEARTSLKRVSLTLRKNENLPTVGVDPELIKRVIANLLSNALRHTPEGGEIEGRLDYYTENNSILLIIRDSGEGVPPEYQEKIFEKFEQVKMAKSIVSVGAGGLGLAFCKMAVEAHGGKIWLESEGSGKGSAFHFTIPLFL